MILILDDTFNERKSDYDLDFLNENNLKNKVIIKNDVIITELGKIMADLKLFSAIACHSSLKFRNKTNTDFLSQEDNLNYFKETEKEIIKSNIPYISISGSITENKIVSDNRININKRDFYINLNNFVSQNEINLKVLLLGVNYLAIELQNTQSNILYLIKELGIDDTINTAKVNFKNEIINYNNVAKVKSDIEWLSLINEKYNTRSKLTELLNKITTSFIKYGKCIYNIG